MLTCFQPTLFNKMHFSLLALLTVLATGAAGAPASPEAPDRRSGIGSWMNGEWNKVENKTKGLWSSVEGNIENDLHDVTDGAAWKAITNATEICGPCIGALSNTAGSCTIAAATLGDDIVQDAQCLYDAGSKVMDFPDSCETCLKHFGA
ncbi:hypothetical protein C8R47DRAFT_1229984 [Mycena vitilis]|nr:hypothetical protein C8R47DRAFT_1229984 [Mycena vitilis]